MIHPSQSSSIGTRSGLRRSMFFFSLSFLLAGANFLPLLVESALEDVPMPPTTEYYLQLCYLLSLPMLFEFFVDIIVSQFSPSACRSAEPRLGYFVILLSLFLPVVTVDRSIQDESSPWKILFVLCFVNFLQTLVIIGKYDKLHFRTKGHWQSSSCLGIVFLYVASHVCLTLGISFHETDLGFCIKEKLCMGCAVACAVGALLLHSYHCKRYILNFLQSQFRGVPGPKLLVDDFVAVALQCIAFVCFLLNCLACVGVLRSRSFLFHTNSVVINHIVLGLCAAIIPGRVMRKNFMLLNDKMAVKDTFIRYVSHEIRSPLSTTSLGLNYLLDRLKADEIKMPEVLEVVQESVVTCELAMDTLNDFLMLDKIQSNMIEVSSSYRLASEFVLDAVKPFRLQASSSNITLSCNVETSDNTMSLDAKIDIDSYKMNQVLRNLLSNACKFTPSGGTVSVTLSVQEDTTKRIKMKGMDQCVDGHCPTVRVDVKDSGCGISAENLPKLFGQYVQFDAAKLQGGKGSGLGLWLSKAIVEMHGGRIGAESEGEGRGCTFWIELPCVLPSGKAAFNGEGEVTHSFASHEAPPIGQSVTPCITTSFDVRDRFEIQDIESGGGGGGVSGFNVRTPSNGHRTPNLEVALSVSSLMGKKYVDLQEMVTSQYKRSPLAIAVGSGSSLSKGSPSSCDKKGVRALLVDDSTIARKMVERSLTTIGVVCIHAVNGREAVEKVRQSMNSDDPAVGYDVILMDHHMPEMSGPEAVEVIRNELGYKGVIMGVSGNASADSDFEKLLSCGKIDKVVVKPFKLDVFVEFMSVELKDVIG